MRTIAVLSFAVLLLGVSSTTTAQLRLGINEIDVSAYPEVRLIVHATDDGSNVRGLSVTDFTVFEDGVIMPITEGFCEDTLARTPVSVLLLIDVSRSMGPWPFGNNGLSDAKRAAKLFIDRLGNEDSVALVSYSDDVRYDQPWTGDRDLIKRRIDELRWWGRTALWDGVTTSANLIRFREQRRVMIVLADGDDNSSDTDETIAINSAIQANCTVYTIGLGTKVTEAPLRRLADQTGGRYYKAPSSSDLDQIYAEINQELETTGICELRYQSPIDCWNGDEVLVEAQVRNGGRTATSGTTYFLPYDTTTFSYVHVAMGRDYVVEAGEEITIPVELTRVSPERAPSVFEFSVDFDTDLLQLAEVTTGSLVPDYTVTVSPTLRGADVRLSGGDAVINPGEISFLTFRAAPVFSSAKSEIGISPPEVQQFCTVASSDNGLITVSGTCERALSPFVGIADNRAQPLTMLTGSTPNPVRDGAVIGYHLATEGHVTIRVSNIMGEPVATLVDGPAEAGDHSVRLNPGTLPSGRYFVLMTTSSGSDQMAIVVAR